MPRQPATSASIRLPLWKRLVFAVMTTIAFLGFVELALELIPTIYLAIHTPPPAAPGDLDIFCFGDSVTFGTGVGPEESWPYRLQTRLSDAAYPVAVYNGGYPADGWAKLPERTRVLVRYSSPDRRAIALLMMGHNDIIGWGHLPFDNAERQAFQETRPRLVWSGLRLLRVFRWVQSAVADEAPVQAPVNEALISQIRSALADLSLRMPGVQPYLLTYVVPGEPQTTLPNFPANLIHEGRAAQQAYNAQLRELATMFGLPLIDVDLLVPAPDIWTSEWFQDNIHLTAMGYDEVAAAVFTELKASGELPTAR